MVALVAGWRGRRGAVLPHVLADSPVSWRRNGWSWVGVAKWVPGVMRFRGLVRFWWPSFVRPSLDSCIGCPWSAMPFALASKHTDLPGRNCTEVNRCDLLTRCLGWSPRPARTSALAGDLVPDGLTVPSDDPRHEAAQAAGPRVREHENHRSGMPAWSDSLCCRTGCRRRLPRVLPVDLSVCLRLARCGDTNRYGSYLITWLGEKYQASEVLHEMARDALGVSQRLGAQSSMPPTMFLAGRRRHR